MGDYRNIYFKRHDRNRYKCSICSKKLHRHEVQVDHIIPKSKIEINRLWNLQPSCETCNKSKSNKVGFFTLKYLYNNFIDNNIKNIIIAEAVLLLANILNIFIWYKSITG